MCQLDSHLVAFDPIGARRALERRVLIVNMSLTTPFPFLSRSLSGLLLQKRPH